MFESPWHWAVVAIVAFILFFGWKNLPDMSRSLGRSLRIFKTEIKGMGLDDKEREENDSPKALNPAPAQVVKNPVARTDAPAAPRPRPTPRPTASSSASSDRPADR